MLRNLTRIRFGRWRAPRFVGCLVLPFVLCLLALIFGLLFILMRSSAVYQGAVDELRSDPAAVRALGEPIRPGLFWSGSISTSGSTGYANLAIPVSGPRGRGTLHVSARKSDDGWSYTQLRLTLKDGGEPIDVLRER